MRIQKKELRELAKLFQDHSPLFIVGGFVRNKLLGLPLKDIDICSSCSLDEVKEILNGTKYSLVIKNKKLNTAEIRCNDEVYEYSAFREENYTEGGKHNPSYVRFDTNIVQDAKRRDFTINCIYYSLSTHEIIDFYGGINDLNKKQIRTIETPDFVLQNDGARILRLARFASEFNFSVHKKTLLSAIEYAKNIETQSQKTKLNELVGIITCNQKYKGVSNYEVGIKFLDKISAWKYIFKNDDILKNIKSVYKILSATKRSQSIEHFIFDLYNYYNKKKKTTLSQFNEIFMSALN